MRVVALVCGLLALLGAERSEARGGVCVSKGGTPILSGSARDCEIAGGVYSDLNERREPSPTLHVCHSKAGTPFERLNEAECRAQGWEMREVAREDMPDASVAQRSRGGASRRCEDGVWRADCDSTEEPPERSPDVVQEFKAVVEAQGVLRARCSQQWPADFSMQEYCIEQQQEGARKVSAWTSSPAVAGDPQLRAVVVACDEKWTDAHGRNWPMIDYCIEQQVGAYRRLR